MNFKMAYGLKIGCIYYMTGLLSCLVLTSKAQQWSPTPTFDLPVYGIYHNNIPDGELCFSHPILSPYAILKFI
jgi:hypothetical protein